MQTRFTGLVKINLATIINGIIEAAKESETKYALVEIDTRSEGKGLASENNDIDTRTEGAASDFTNLSTFSGEYDINITITMMRRKREALV